MKSIAGAIAVGVTALLGGTWTYYAVELWRRGFGLYATTGSEVFLVLWMVGIPLLLVSTARQLTVQRNLLAYGEATLGRVLEIRLVGKHRRHRIKYSFEDKLGRTFTASGYDDSRQLVEGSGIPIFYEESSPGDRSVPLCGTIWRIIGPNSETAS